MKQYTKREFLKLLGLGIAFSPFLSLYSSCTTNSGTKDTPKKNDQQGEEPNTQTEESPLIQATDNDVIILQRDSKDFATYNEYFNARVHKLPLYIAICKTNLGVQYAIQLARKEQLPIAIRSGGHSFEGFSCNDGGLVLHVANLKKHEWINTNTLTLEAGLVLKEVQNILFEKKQLIPTGSCGTVGISGLTLGGGYGFFSRKYGLTCDQLIDATLIDYNGKIHKAKDNPSLLWALKGGGNGNFGVVTDFTFKTHTMPANFSASVLKFRKMDADRFQETLKTFFNCTNEFSEEDFGAYVLNGTTLTILLTTYGHQDLLLSKSKKLIQLSDSNSSSTTPLPQAMKRYYGRNGPLLFKNASAGLYQSYEEIEAILPQIFELVIHNKGLIYQINTLGGAINSKNYEGASCYPHRSIPYLSELQAYYDNKSQEPRLLQAFEDIQQIIKKHGITAQYRNYPDINFSDWQHAYYGNNYEQLQTIKKQYDPEHIFSYEQSIAPSS